MKKITKSGRKLFDDKHKHLFGEWFEVDSEYHWTRGGYLAQGRRCELCNFVEYHKTEF